MENKSKSSDKITMKPFLVLVYHEEKLLTYATGAPDEKSAILAASQQLVNENKSDAITLGVFSKTDIGNMNQMIDMVEKQIEKIMNS